MSTSTNSTPSDFQQWAKKQSNKFISEVAQQNLFNTVTVECKVAWGIVDRILIGQIRSTQSTNPSYWFICGDNFSSDYIAEHLAPSPRDAAKHFVLKWQLGAEQIKNLSSEALANLPGNQDHIAAAGKLIDDAEYLYDISQQDNLWI